MFTASTVGTVWANQIWSLEVQNSVSDLPSLLSVLTSHLQSVTDTTATLVGLLIMHSEVNAMKMMDQGDRDDNLSGGSNDIGLYTTFVGTTKRLSAKRALDPVHALLGVSHSW